MEPKKQTLWALVKQQIIFRILIIIVFLVSSLTISILEAILYISLRPWNHRLYREIDTYLASLIGYPVPVFVLHWWAGCKYEIIVDSSVASTQLETEHTVLIPNHNFSIDWLLLYPFASYLGVVGNHRIFTKKAIQYLPPMGWSWKLHENPLLDRNWEKDKRNFIRQVTGLIFDNDPGMLVLFPEGTRITESKHKASMAVARAKGIPELKHHLLPRTKGFVELVKVLRNPNLPRVPVGVYDTLIAVKGMGDEKSKKSPLSLMSVLRGQPAHVKILLRRYSVEEIPKDENECSNWLHERFQEKDKLLDNFLKTGSFFTEEEKQKDFKEYQSIFLPRKLNILINFVFTSVLILGPIFAYTVTSMITHLTINSTVFFPVFLVLGYIVLNALDNVNSIEKGSTYGLKSK